MSHRLRTTVLGLCLGEDSHSSSFPSAVSSIFKAIYSDFHNPAGSASLHTMIFLRCLVTWAHGCCFLSFFIINHSLNQVFSIRDVEPATASSRSLLRSLGLSFQTTAIALSSPAHPTVILLVSGSTFSVAGEICLVSGD